MPAFYIEQFGCRATQADGAALERQLLDRGFTPARESVSAEVIVVNTCTVTSAADTQARDAIRKFHAANPAAHIVVTGCYAQRAPEELAILPGVSYVVGNSHKPQIPQLLTQISAPLSTPHLVKIDPSTLELPHLAPILISDILSHSELLAAPVLGGESNHTRPTLKIQDGCNLRCSYCVIPFVRGKSRSLPPETVLQEIQRLSDSGFREIVLSGINLGTYGRDLSPRVEFEDLLRRILDETSVEHVRISSIEPQDVTQDLVELFASSNRIAPHFHMPLQSGSDRILAAMHRWYRTEHYARRVELIHDRLPMAAIGADIITGFPGEAEEDHAATIAFIERLPFTYLHVFSYSARPGTKAASLPNQIPRAIVKRRARQLRALSDQKATIFRQSQIGQTIRVLTLRRDSADHQPEHLSDHSENFQPAPLAQKSPAKPILNAPSNAFTPAISTNFTRVRVAGIFPANQWLNVFISSQEGNYLVGEPQLEEHLLRASSAHSASLR